MRLAASAILLAGCSLAANADDHLPPCSSLVLEGGSIPVSGTEGAAPAAFTIEAWLRPELSALNGNVNIAGIWGNAEEGTGSYALFLMDGHPGLALSCDGMGISLLNADDPLSAGGWTHVAVTFAQGDAAVFVGGRRVGETRWSCSMPEAQYDLPFTLAYDDPVAGDPYRGRMDELRVSRRARYDGDFSPATVLGSDADTFLLYHFSDEELTDSSGNNHDATLADRTYIDRSECPP